MSSSPQQQVSPELFFDTVTAYQHSAILAGAIDLDVFTAIGEGNTDVPSLARRTNASERGTRILADTLVVIGFLTKEGDRYALTPDTAVFLDRRSPAYVGAATRFLLSPTIRAAFDDVATVVRTGTTTLPEGGSVAPAHDVWVDFARGMAALMQPPGELMAKLLDLGDRPARILDIAAGHGMFGVTLLRHAPNATVVALDWPAVLEVATENAVAAGVGDRHSTLPGSAFEVEFGTGYDVILITN
jgi:hypothetical protein